MLNTTRNVLCGGLISAMTVAAQAGVITCIPDQQVDGRMIVRVAEGVTIGQALAELSGLVPAATITLVDPSLADRDLYLIEFAPLALNDEVEAAAVAAASVVWAESLYLNHDPEGNTGSVWFHSVGGVGLFLDQYATTAVSAGSAQQHATGAGVTVAVLDTGIDASHPAFEATVAPGGYNFVDGSSDTSERATGLDLDGDGQIDEAFGHGTFVAGLVHLIAPDATILPVVVLDAEGHGDFWTLTQGMYYAIDDGADVINLSLGSTYDSQALYEAILDAQQQGITVVSAGGNLGLGEECEQFAAAFDVGIGVAAVDDLDVKADFSNYHQNFVISAPGASLGDAQNPDPEHSIHSAVPGGEYGTWEGTSFSTALVSGAAALVRSQHPGWPNAQVGLDAIPTQVQSVLAASADSIDGINPAYAGMLGSGRLDAFAAVLHGLGDLDFSGSVDVLDFLALIGQWGTCTGPCTGDLDDSGAVDTVDFLTLLGNWGLSSN